jgi:TetR/AcrR family fatty acid metabolism transcriptional regulator
LDLLTAAKSDETATVGQGGCYRRIRGPNLCLTFAALADTPRTELRFISRSPSTALGAAGVSMTITRPKAGRGDKREKILTAAVKIFAKNGFYNAKISQIAKEAGVADGTIYLYFKNKDDLLISTFEEVMGKMNERLVRELADLERPLDKLKRSIRLHLALALDHRYLAEFITIELRQSTKFIKQYKNRKFSEYLRILRDVVIEGQKRGEIRQDLDPRIVTRAIFGALDEALLTFVLTQHGRSDGAQEIERQCQQLENVFISGLWTPAAASSGEVPQASP